MEISAEQLQKMQEVDIQTVDIDTLTDLQEIEIDEKAPVEEKMAALMRQTSNLYVYRVGDYAVKICYQEDGPTIDEKMEEYIKELAQLHI